MTVPGLKEASAILELLAAMKRHVTLDSLQALLVGKTLPQRQLALL